MIQFNHLHHKQPKNLKIHILILLAKVICIPFLASGVPYLSLDGLVINDESFSLKLYSNGCLGIEAEFVPSKACKQLSFSNCRVPNQHHLEHVINLLVIIPVQIRHPRNSLTHVHQIVVNRYIMGSSLIIIWLID